MKKLGENFELSFGLNVRQTEWLIVLQNAERVLIKNGTIQSRYKKNYTYQCIPSSENCNSLFVTNFNTELIGSYSKNKKWFELVGYDAPLNIKCIRTDLNKCDYNSEKRFLYIKEDKKVTIQCSGKFLIFFVICLLNQYSYFLFFSGAMD